MPGAPSQTSYTPGLSSTDSHGEASSTFDLTGSRKSLSYGKVHGGQGPFPLKGGACVEVPAYHRETSRGNSETSLDKVCRPAGRGAV